MDRNKAQMGEFLNQCKSLSARRAWIEINCKEVLYMGVTVSLSARRAWIEIAMLMQYLDGYRVSLSARRAWIEIPSMHIEPTKGSVALRKESVDRN